MDEINKQIDLHKNSIERLKKLVQPDIDHHIEQIHKLKNERRNLCSHPKPILKKEDNGNHSLYCEKCVTYIHY